MTESSGKHTLHMAMLHTCTHAHTPDSQASHDSTNQVLSFLWALSRAPKWYLCPAALAWNSGDMCLKRQAAAHRCFGIVGWFDPVSIHSLSYLLQECVFVVIVVIACQCVCFEAGSSYVAFLILLPLPPESYDCKCAPIHRLNPQSVYLSPSLHPSPVLSVREDLT